MRYAIVMLLLAVAAFSCNSPTPAGSAGPAADTSAVYSYPYDTLEGIYIGDFGGSDIRIIIAHATGIHAVGYDLHKGLRRNLSGTMQQSGNGFTFALNEPGDHQFDGKFSFAIDTNTFTLTGTWTPLNDKTLAPQSFTLKKQLDTGYNQYEIYLRYSDSIGYFIFTKEGVCVYEFYPVTDGKIAEQLIRVKGTWTLKDSIYTVDWQSNTVFPNRKSTFVRKSYIDTDTAYIPPRIIGEGRTLIADEF